MSGGSLDYCKGTLQEIANKVCDGTSPWERDTRKALREMLLALADTLHELEWYLSDDTGPGDYVDALWFLPEALEKPLARLKARLNEIEPCECNRLGTCPRCAGAGYVFRGTDVPIHNEEG